jgi:hypothetical protein
LDIRKRVKLLSHERVRERLDGACTESCNGLVGGQSLEEATALLNSLKDELRDMKIRLEGRLRRQPRIKIHAA